MGHSFGTGSLSKDILNRNDCPFLFALASLSKGLQNSPESIEFLEFVIRHRSEVKFEGFVKNE